MFSQSFIEITPEQYRGISVNPPLLVVPDGSVALLPGPYDAYLIPRQRELSCRLIYNQSSTPRADVLN